MGHVTLLRGHAPLVLAGLPAESVHCVVTSPPYWGLRDYGLEPQVWGGDEATLMGHQVQGVSCAHEWTAGPKIHTGGADEGGAAGKGRGGQQARNAVKDRIAGEFCLRCGAWCGHLGLEPTPELYIEHMVGLFREVRRVLRKDGTVWLNMGDCYATGAGRVGTEPGGGEQGARWKGDVNRIRDEKRGYRGTHLQNQSHMGKQLLKRKGSNRAQRGDGNEGVAYGPMTQPNRMPIAGLKAKDLVMMPARLALALQADGWWLRAEIVWSKPNPMPESVTDRPTRAHEYIFLLARSERYFYDAAAIAEPASEATIVRVSQVSLDQQQGGSKTEQYAQGFPGKKNRDRKPVEIVQAVARKFDGNGRIADHQGDRRRPPDDQPDLNRNARTVWEISTQPYPEAHFATFPEELARRCILAGSSPRTCEKCGAPWKRLIVATGGTIGRAWNDHQDDLQQGNRAERRAKGNEGGYRRREAGWKATCRCEQEGKGRSVVLDPFGGSGTTAQIATGHGRDALYIDLNPEYLELARHRIGPLLCR